MKSMNNIVLHLMVNNECTNDCPLCCNKQYDVGKIPVVTVEELKQTETICITGGEPFLSKNLISFLENLFKSYVSIKNCIIYTSGGLLGAINLKHLLQIQRVQCVNIGLSIGPKSLGDRNNLRFKSDIINNNLQYLATNRLYCFTEADKKVSEYYKDSNIDIIDRKWQKDFIPAPNTIFRRLPIWI